MMMKPLHTLLLAAAMLAAGPARAESSVASSASESLSTSVGSASTSIQQSSDGSSKTTRVAAGEYRVLALADVPGATGMARLQLQAETAPEGPDTLREFALLLPRQALLPHALVSGDRVLVTQRPYGLEFAHLAPRQPFFLVLDEAWYRELDARPVVISKS